VLTKKKPGAYEARAEENRKKKHPLFRGNRSGNNFHCTVGFGKLHISVRKSEKGEISAASDIPPGTESGSALTKDDASRGNEFSAKGLDAQHFRLTVAPVSAAGLSFFMCHDISPWIFCFLNMNL